MLFFYMLSLLLTAVLIPLFDPAFTLVVLIIFEAVNIVLIFKFPFMKFRLMLYTRIIHEFFYVVFNLTFLMLYAVERYFP